jgi:dihydropyrimidinase
VPAKVFDLAPLKGTLDPGADADFTLVDLDKERVLHAADFASYADYNLHEGWNLKGWPVRAISRGVTVMDEHKIVGKGGHGKYLWRRIGQPPIPGKTR